MKVKFYKRTGVSRTEEEQDSALAPSIAQNPDAPFFYDDDRDMLLRPTTRKEASTVHAGSFALFADDPQSMEYFLRGCKARRITLIGAEEGYTWTPSLPAHHAMGKWLEARKHGAAHRGARKSAETKKANTAAALELVKHELESTDTPSKTILAKVRIRAIATIKNHFGVPREELQRRYQAEQKRKERREKYREQHA